MIRSIHTDKAPKAIGPYSQAVDFAGLVFCSGQVGKDPSTNKLATGIEKQTEFTLANLEAVLKAANSEMQYVLKTTVYLKNVEDFPKMNAIYEKHFGDHKPARATVEVSNLPQGALVEIEAIAIRVEDHFHGHEHEGDHECQCGGQCGH